MINTTTLLGDIFGDDGDRGISGSVLSDIGYGTQFTNMNTAVFSPNTLINESAVDDLVINQSGNFDSATVVQMTSTSFSMMSDTTFLIGAIANELVVDDVAVQKTGYFDSGTIDQATKTKFVVLADTSFCPGNLSAEVVTTSQSDSNTTVSTVSKRAQYWN